MIMLWRLTGENGRRKCVEPTPSKMRCGQENDDIRMDFYHLVSTNISTRIFIDKSVNLKEKSLLFFNSNKDNESLSYKKHEVY